MVKKLFLTATVCVAMVSAVQAEQKPVVSMSVASFQEIVVKDKKGKIKKDKNGKPIKKWVKASKVVPNDIIKYINTITNDKNESLANAKITNPIDPNLEFIADSAKSKAKFSAKYSVDGGKSFSEPSKLFVKDKKGKKIQAQAKHYNAIEFIVDEVPAKSKVEVSYKVKLK